MNNARKHFRYGLLLVGVLTFASLVSPVLAAEGGAAALLESNANEKIRSLERQIEEEKGKLLETDTGSHRENLTWGTGWGLRAGALGLMPAGGFSPYGSQIDVGIKFPDFIPGFYLVTEFGRVQGEIYSYDTNWGIQAKVRLFLSTRLLLNFLKLYTSAAGGVLYKGPAYFPDYYFDSDTDNIVIRGYFSEDPKVFAVATLNAGGEVYLNSWAAVWAELNIQFSDAYDGEKKFAPPSIAFIVGFNLYLPSLSDARDKP